MCVYKHIYIYIYIESKCSKNKIIYPTEDNNVYRPLFTTTLTINR